MKDFYIKLKKEIIKGNIGNIFSLFLFLILVHNINSEITECLRETPILKSGQCKLDYCSKTDFSSSNCIIANSTIKTQWLNNFIVFGNSTYRYINFATFEIGDMIVETTCFPKANKRMYFGLKKNGRPYFTKNGENIFTSVDILNDNNGKLEAEGEIIKLSTDEGIEYFMSISKIECNAEITDFSYGSKGKIYYKPVRDLTDIYQTTSLRHAFIPLESTSPNYYYLFGFLGNPQNVETTNFYIQRHQFKYLNNFVRTKTMDKSKLHENAYGREVSCFQSTTNKLIICFYLTKKTTTNTSPRPGNPSQTTTKYYFNLLKYKKDLKDPKNHDTIESSITESSLFLKCIHLKGDAGVFVSYEKSSSKNYPFFLLKIMM